MSLFKIMITMTINNKNNNNSNNNDGDNNNYNNNNDDDDDDFKNNSSKLYWKISENDISYFHYFGCVIAAQGVIYHPRVRIGVIKLQQIISKHKQAFIPSISTSI